MPTRSFVDGAAILGAIEALSAGKPQRATNWAVRSAVEVTTSLLLVPSVTLSPIPESHNSPVGPYGAVLGELAGLVVQRAPDVEVSRATLRTTRRWAMSHPADLNSYLDDLRADESYHRWLEWLMHNQWLDHIGRHGALFEEAFLIPISRALEIPSENLRAIRIDTATESAVRRIGARPDEELSRIVREAFTLSTLLRGRYYDRLSKAADQHVLHHPIRYRALPRLPAGRTVDLSLSNTAWFMSAILIACAFNERGSGRGAAWARSIKRARDGIASGELDVAHKETDEVAIRVAARNVARLGLRTHQPWIDQVTSAAVAVGLGVLTSFFLTGWEAVGVGATAQLAMESTRLTTRAAARVSGDEHRLQRLGRMQAGRIGARWQLP